jgi:hypothetical protein
MAKTPWGTLCRTLKKSLKADFMKHAAERDISRASLEKQGK